MEDWPVPEPLPRVRKSGMHVCPIVGLPLRENADIHALREYWFKYDSRIWYMKHFRRRSLYTLLKRKWDDWQEFLRIDSTPTFYREISALKKRNDGAVIGIAGPKGCSKSTLGGMIVERAVSTTPHVLFQYKDLASHVRTRTGEAIAVQIDEDLTSTGSDSKNLVKHVNNAFETSRKAEFWAICSGVNLSFESWGETLDLRIIPFGYNVRFQATRFAIMSKEKEFLGMCALQRKHRPDDIVQFYNEIGFWGQYKARAIAFSNEVLSTGGALDAIDDKEQDKHIAEMTLYFQEHYIDEGKKIPSDIKCRRLYRKAKIPSKSVGYMVEVIAWAKDSFDDDDDDINVGRGARKAGVFTDAWGVLRFFVKDWLLRKATKKAAYAVATAQYLIKAEGFEDLTQDEVAENIKREFKLTDKVKTISRNIRILRKKIQRPDVMLTDFTETWLASQLDSLGAKKVGKQGQPDIILQELHDKEVAVKFSVAADPWIEYPISPETDGVVVVILPRTRQFYVHRITGLSLALDNSRVKNSGRLVGIDGLVDAVKEMIEK